MTEDIVPRLRATETLGEPLMPWHVTPNEAADEIERLRKEVARLGSFIHPIGTIIHDNSRKFAETLGSGEHVSAPFGGTVKDVHSSCIDEIERLQAELDHWQHIAKTLGDGYSLTDEIRPALQEVYMKFYASSPAVMDAI